MICFCASCSSLSGIGAPFLYLLCIAKVTNSQLMERFDEVNRRIDRQDETLKSIQSSLLELTSAVKALVKTQDAKDAKEGGPDACLVTDAEESDEQLHDDSEKRDSSSAINRVTKLEFPSSETMLGNCNDSLNNCKMSENPRDAGPRTEWKPNTKIETDEPFGSASSCDQKANCPFPSVKYVASGMENSKPMPDSCQKADDGLKQPKSVSTFDYNSNNSNHTYPVPTKSQQGEKSDDNDDGKEGEPSSAINCVTKLEFPSSETLFANSSDSLNKRKMSEFPHCHGYRFAAAKNDGRGRYKKYGLMKHNNAGPRPDLKSKTKIATDEYIGSASCSQKADSSLSNECISEKISCFTYKPDSDIQSQEKPSLPSSYKPMPDSCQKADNDSKQPKSVSIFDHTSKDSTHMHPIPTKSQQGTESQDGISKKGKQIGDTSKPEDSNHASFTTFDICPKKVNTGVLKLKTSLLEKNREKRKQMKLAAQGPNIIILKPGMVLMKGYISCDDQVKIVKTCRELGIDNGGFYQPGYSNGAKLHFRMMCLGKNWDPESRQYSEIRTFDNSKPPKIPDLFHDMMKRAIQDSNAHIKKNSGKIIPSMLPDICVAKFYTKDGKLGLHQDKDESRESLERGLPVVSLSIGDSGEFLYGNDRDIEKAEKVNLESGDVLIFGGESRHLFHGVSSILPDTAPRSLLEATDMRDGRLNLTFRQF